MYSLRLWQRILMQNSVTAGDIALLVPLAAVLFFSVQRREENESPIHFILWVCAEYFVKHALNSPWKKTNWNKNVENVGWDSKEHMIAIYITEKKRQSKNTFLEVIIW